MSAHMPIRPHTRPFIHAQRKTHFLSRGFTLIEVMVVVVIIGILAALIVPNILSRPNQARVVAARNDIRAISSAIQLYQLDNIQYPNSLQDLAQKPSSARNWREGGYMDTIKSDPWGNSYQYVKPGQHNPNGYDLYSYGSDGQIGGEGDAADIGNWD